MKNSVDILGKIFGSPARVKIMKLFISNTETDFDIKEIEKRALVSSTSATKELKVLVGVSFVKEKKVFREIVTKTKGAKKKRIQGYILNPDFEYLIPLKNLLLDTHSLENGEIRDLFRKVGNIKMIVLSGIFIHDPDSRADILIVGDNIDNSSFSRAIKILESRIGKELRYILFETDDFKYRLQMYDKLLRDVFDYPHKKIIDKLILND